MIPRKLVDHIGDVRMMENDRGYSTGSAFFDDTGASTSWRGPMGLYCSIHVVEVGKRSPLLAAMHSEEEMGLVLAGSGHYEVMIRVRGEPAVVVSSVPVREGSILLAPEGHADMRFELFNSGSTELKFIAFQSNRSAVDLARLDAARAVIDRFIEREGNYWTEGYNFDGRVLCLFERSGFQILITFDQFGTIWVDGTALTGQAGEISDSRVERLAKAVEAARRKFYDEERRRIVQPI